MKKVVRVQKTLEFEIEIDDEDLEGLSDKEVNELFITKAEQSADEAEEEVMWDYGYGWKVVDDSAEQPVPKKCCGNCKYAIYRGVYEQYGENIGFCYCDWKEKMINPLLSTPFDPMDGDNCEYWASCDCKESE